MYAESPMEQFWQTSHLWGGNAAYIEELYEAFLRDPHSIPLEWQEYFQKLPKANGTLVDVPHSPVREHFLLLAKNKTRHQPLAASSVSTEHERKQVKVLHLITAYRFRGHQKANLDPLGLLIRPPVPDLELSFHQLSEADLDTVFQTGSLFLGKEEATLREIIQAIEQTYCGTLGIEYMHITDTVERRWIQQRVESVRSHPNLTAGLKKHLLERLTAAEGLEKYLGSKYPGTKRFGLEGGESLIPLLDEIVQRAGDQYGVLEIVMGMAHRGRLNVLVNILGKQPKELFEEFEGKKSLHNPDQGSGDVKYHQGFSSNVLTAGGEIHLALAFNPSHLEIVSPVVEGSVRARQDRRKDATGDKVIPILMHGDAAFAGQGVVMETFQLSQTRGYRTGGTIHVIINNQVGFTTSHPQDARSTEYCTDVAKMIQAPILHVNADDPEAVYFATQLVLDYRMAFKKDIVIDLICYRRRGHNEADEPAATQPLMYQKIRQLATTRILYAEQLVKEAVLTQAEADVMGEQYRQELEEGSHVVKSLVKEPNKTLFVDWTPYIGHAYTMNVDTRVPIDTIQNLGKKLEQLPEEFVLQQQVQKIMEDRQKMTAGALPVNWGYAEVMAYATLLQAGYPVRIAGQDSGRGTFSHRHAVLYSQKDGATHIPLKHVSDEQPRFDLYDSLLSEEAALAFEYGYSTTTPGTLVVWEAQFGDFANGAQVVIDQFITSGEHKWARLCGLVMLLPHGYEGQGPEHSSARLERYLQSCAEHNIQVCLPTTPAQIFHLLRRQSIRPLRKPLVVMTPKSLLRHKLAISTLEELAKGTFQPVFPEIDKLATEKITRLILCSGKVYYDLLEKRRSEKREDAVIIRIEQLYPFPEEELQKIVAIYPKLKHVVWCQEEPMNQGAWYCSQHHMRRCINSLYLLYAGRLPSAAPAAGYLWRHAEEQAALLEQAFTVTS